MPTLKKFQIDDLASALKNWKKITNETKKEKKNINRPKVSKEKYKDTNIKVEDNKIKQRKQ